MSEYGYTDAGQNWPHSYLWPALIRQLERLAPPPTDILEIGCGNGATARMLAARGYRVVGFDPSESGIAIAKTFDSENLSFHRAGVGDELARSLGKFPVVISLEVIEHCPSAREFMTTFRGAMGDGAVGILSTPYHAFLKNLAVIFTGKFDHHFDPLWEGGHLKFFSIPKLTELAHEFGLMHCEFHRVGRFAPIAKSVLAVLRE